MDKAHRWDQLSISMTKTCGNSVAFLLKLILKSMINKGIFPKGWKKTSFYKIKYSSPVSLAL